jgi:hypothetical protein
MRHEFAALQQIRVRVAPDVSIEKFNDSRPLEATEEAKMVAIARFQLSLYR